MTLLIRETGLTSLVVRFLKDEFKANLSESNVSFFSFYVIEKYFMLHNL